MRLVTWNYRMWTPAAVNCACVPGGRAAKAAAVMVAPTTAFGLAAGSLPWNKPSGSRASLPELDLRPAMTTEPAAPRARFCISASGEGSSADRFPVRPARLERSRAIARSPFHRRRCERPSAWRLLRAKLFRDLGEEFQPRRETLNHYA